MDISMAEQAFNEGRYMEAIDICTEIAKNGTRDIDIYIIATKAALFAANPLENEQAKKVFLESYSLGATVAQTIEDANRFQYEVMVAYEQWYHRAIREALQKVVETCDESSFQAYNHLPEKFNMLKLPLIMNFATNANIKKLRSQPDYDKNNNYSLDDISAEYGLSDMEKCSLEFDAARQLFEQGKAVAEEYNDVSLEAAQSIVKPLITKFMWAELLADIAVDNRERAKQTEEDKQQVIEELKEYAAMKDYRLNLLLHPNGQPFSLITGDRTDDINKLKVLYSRIKAYDPYFIEPALPAKMSTDLPKKGGCYVATAVYGSYDCPEVWTLRRFRDYTLAETWYGRAFIHTYYAISPTLVKWFGNTNWFKNMWRGTLDKMVNSLNNKGVEDTPYEDRVW